MKYDSCTHSVSFSLAFLYIMYVALLVNPVVLNTVIILFCCLQQSKPDDPSPYQEHLI